MKRLKWTVRALAASACLLLACGGARASDVEHKVVVNPPAAAGCWPACRARFRTSPRERLVVRAPTLGPA
jgi:hypothetical protein